MSNLGAIHPARALRTRSCTWAFACLMLGGLAPTALLAGQIGDLRNEVRNKSSRSSQGNASGSSDGSASDDDDGDSLLGCLLSGLFCSDDCPVDSSADSTDGSWCLGLFDVVTTPWGLPHRLSNDDLDDPAWLAAAPYDDVNFKDWSGHFRAEFADDFDDLSRLGWRLILENRSRLGIDAEWNYWQENLGGSDRDWLTTGDANIVFRFAQSEHIAMRSGVGLAWLNDQRETHYGFNFTYGLDYYPCKPWIFSADIDCGTLAGRSLFHGRATAGIIIRHAEVYVGYDYYDVGDVGLNGLMAGLGFWF